MRNYTSAEGTSAHFECYKILVTRQNPKQQTIFENTKRFWPESMKNTTFSKKYPICSDQTQIPKRKSDYLIWRHNELSC